MTRPPKSFDPGPGSGGRSRLGPRLAKVLAVAVLMLGTAPAWAQTEPPADINIVAETRDDGFGRGIAGVGDVDGDGFVDFLGGAGGADAAAEGSGAAYLFYGPLTHDVSARNADVKISGEGLLDGFGDALSSSGDFNGDGFDDVLIGARSNDTNGIQAGRVYLFYGPLAGDLEALDADAIFSGDPFYEMGWSLAAAGDVNGDGLDDILIGAWMADSVGRAFLYHGAPTGELSVDDADAAFTGVIFSELLGESSAAADLNDDGVSDLIIGAPRPPLFGEDPGRAYVFFGPVTGSFRATEADVIVGGQQDNDEFGTAVGAGDMNGDGAQDLIVGAHQLFRDAPGKAYVFNGPLSGPISANNADATIVGEESTPLEGDLFGESVAGVGDTNGDDNDDFLVGASSNAGGGFRGGRVYLFHGPLSGTLPAAAADRVFTGSEDDAFGTSVAAAGDANEDGLADLLAGAPQLFGNNDIGFAGLFFGEGQPPTGLEVVVTPIDPPVVIPPEGGPLRFRVKIVNRSDDAVDFDLWMQLERRGGGLRTSSPRPLALEAGASVTRTMQRHVPAGAPAGTYSLRGLVGDFPIPDDSDAFTFLKE